MPHCNCRWKEDAKCTTRALAWPTISTQLRVRGKTADRASVNIEVLIQIKFSFDELVHDMFRGLLAWLNTLRATRTLCRKLALSTAIMESQTVPAPFRSLSLCRRERIPINKNMPLCTTMHCSTMYTPVCHTRNLDRLSYNYKIASSPTSFRQFLLYSKS